MAGYLYRGDYSKGSLLENLSISRKKEPEFPNDAQL